ncbi:MAG: hypothetical protein PVG91_12315 [Gammaproteobacteria bacterium]|jgi:hypothetical protein
MSEQQTMEIRMNGDDLYLEEVYTDRRVGTIQRLTPVTSSGEADPSRPIRFLGQAQLLTPGGALPLNFEIAADSLEKAIEGFGAAAETALEDTMKRIEEMRREAASSLIVPGSGGGVPGGGVPGGGMPGGGIQMP